MPVHMGYMGHAKLDGNLVFLTGSSLNPVQAIEAPDLSQGTYIKHVYNYGKLEIGGNISGPIDENHGNVYSLARLREASGDRLTSNSISVDIAYYKAQGRSFTNCAINTWEVSVTAGEVAQFTIDFFGAGTEGGGGAGVDQYTGDASATCSKLVTWDQCGVTGFTGSDQVQSFTFTLNNNLERVYKITTPGAATLAPLELAAGFMEITGSVVVYADGPISGGDYDVADGFGADAYCDYEAGTSSQVTMAIGSCPEIMSQAFTPVWQRPEASVTTGLAMYTLNFQGLCFDESSS